MRISVITVTRNCVQNLGDTLDSIQCQSHTEVDRVWIDGDSSDGTIELLRSRRVSPEDTILSEPDDGVYDALNKGIRHARGDVIGFLHGGDIFSDRRVLARIAEVFEDPGVDAAYGDLVYVKKHDPSAVVRYWRAGQFSVAKLARGWMPPHPALYVRRETYARVGGFDTRYAIAADYDQILRMFSSPGLKSRYLPGVLVKMRVGGVSNRSLGAILAKSREDLDVLRRNRVGGVATLLCKNLRKVGQFLQ